MIKHLIECDALFFAGVLVRPKNAFACRCCEVLRHSKADLDSILDTIDRARKDNPYRYKESYYAKNWDALLANARYQIVELKRFEDACEHD